MENLFYNHSVETYILAAIIYDNDNLSKINDIINLSPTMFYDLTNREVFNLMLELSKESYDINSMSIAILAEKKGKDFINQKLTSSIVASFGTDNGLIDNIKHFYQLYLARTTKNLLIKVENDLNNYVDIDDIFSNITEKIAELTDIKSPRKNDLKSLLNEHLLLIDERVKKVATSKNNSYKLGISEIDKYINLEAGNVIAVAGRPGHGKTAFVIDRIKYLTQKYNICTAFFSLEILRKQLNDRLILGEIEKNEISGTGEIIEANDYFRGNFEFNYVDNIMSELSQLQLFIYDMQDKISDYYSIEMKIKSLVKNHNLKIVAIDYLGLINHDSTDKNSSLGEISRKLKLLALELNIVIILLHQLNREVEKRANKTPILSDLRDTGELEQNIDSCLFIIKPAYYHKNDSESLDFNNLDNVSQISIAKNRDGKIPTEVIEFKHSRSMKYFYEENLNNLF